MKKRKLDNWDLGLIQKVSGHPRILGYSNKSDWFEIKKRKDVFTLFLSIYPLDNNNKKISLKSMGFNSRSSYSKYATEQFEIKFTKKEIKSLNIMLEKYLK